MAWEAGAFSADEWSFIQRQLEKVQKFAEGADKNGPEWSAPRDRLTKEGIYKSA